MSKRRTRAQKESARHAFTYTWSSASQAEESEARKPRFEANVKSQFLEPRRGKREEIGKVDVAENTAGNTTLASVKKDIFKSLILSSIILASEIVIYFFWSTRK